MTVKNTPKHYGSVARGFHWLMAALILAMLGVGLYMVRLPMGPELFKFYGMHKATGMIVLGLAVARLMWRQANARVELPPMPALLRFAARASHYALYFFMFAMPLTGWAMSSALGFPVSFFGLFTFPMLVGPSAELGKQLAVLHAWLAYALIGLIGLHGSAALWHHFVRKDNVLRSMLWGRDREI